MKSGRELDALVAEKVMGWSSAKIESADFYTDEAGATRHDIPSYSADFNAAGEVVDKVNREFRLSNKRNEGGWWAYFNDESYFASKGDTAPHAICLAALKAVGYKID